MSAEGFRARARPEPPSAQILVVVANTLERSWRTDAEKGFLSTAVAQVLVDPKPRAKALQRGPHDDPRSAEERRSRPGARPLGAAREPSGVPEARGQASGEARRRCPGPSPRSPPTQTLPARAPSARLRPASRGARTPNPAPQQPERPFSPVTCAAPSELARGGPGADALALERALSRGGLRRPGPGPRWARGLNGRAWRRSPVSDRGSVLAKRRSSLERLALLGAQTRAPQRAHRAVRRSRDSAEGLPGRAALQSLGDRKDRTRSGTAKGNPVKIPGPGE